MHHCPIANGWYDYRAREICWDVPFTWGFTPGYHRAGFQPFSARAKRDDTAYPALCSVDGVCRSRYWLPMSPKFSFRLSPLFPRILTAVLVFLASNSVPAHAAPGDGHWDRQFGAPGTASRNFAL